MARGIGKSLTDDNGTRCSWELIASDKTLRYMTCVQLDGEDTSLTQLCQTLK